MDSKRKPDISLFEPNGDSWPHLVTFCEVKNKADASTEKDSYIELAGKSACLLFMQDGRHLAPSIRILGSDIYFTLFDRGGSISTCGFNIHDSPNVFLRIIIGLSCYRDQPNILGSDTSITWETKRKTRRLTPPRKVLKVTVRRELQTVSIRIALTKLLFISDTLLGRGTTVWQGETKKSEALKVPKSVAVKDTWIDPLRKYTEGAILRILNKAGIEGVPLLIYEGQVSTKVCDNDGNQTTVNNSTHSVRAVLERYACSEGTFQLRVLYRLVTEPVGSLVTDFRSLAELIVAFLDFVVGKQDVPVLRSISD